MNDGFSSGGDLGVIIERMTGGSGRGKSERERVPTVHPLAQADTLIQANMTLARNASRPPLQPGTLVRQAAQFSTFKPSVRLVGAVLRPINYDDPFDKLLLAEYVRETPVNVLGLKPDIVLMDVARSNNTVVLFWLAASATLEVVSTDDLKNWPLPPEGAE